MANSSYLLACRSDCAMNKVLSETAPAVTTDEVRSMRLVRDVILSGRQEHYLRRRWFGFAGVCWCRK